MLWVRPGAVGRLVADKAEDIAVELARKAGTAASRCMKHGSACAIINQEVRHLARCPCQGPELGVHYSPEVEISAA